MLRLRTVGPVMKSSFHGSCSAGSQALQFFVIIFHFKYICQQGDNDKHLHCALLFVSDEKLSFHKPSGLKGGGGLALTCVSHCLCLLLEKDHNDFRAVYDSFRYKKLRFNSMPHLS